MSWKGRHGPDEARLIGHSEEFVGGWSEEAMAGHRQGDDGGLGQDSTQK